MQKQEFTILWDFDGTLFDTYPAYTKIFKKVLNNKNVCEAEIYKQLKVSFRHACSYFNISEAQYEEINSHEKKINPVNINPFDGVEEVLKHVNKNVIMTHKPKEEVLAILKYHKWEDYFSEIVAGDDGFPRKPDPASYEYLHNRHHIDLVVGDREIDIIPGKVLGIKTCLYQHMSKYMADFYIDDYRDFFKIVHMEDLKL